jgi:hypothetical protein
MKRLRWWTFALVLQLALFYNLERLLIDQGVVVNIELFPYALVLVATLATLAVPALSQAPVWGTLAGWAVVYVVGHLILLPQVSLVGTDHIYTFVIELGMLTLAVVLATQVTRALRAFARAVEQLTIPDAERWVLEIGHAADTIRAEVNRSRRYQRPLSVLVVEPMLDTVRFTLERLFAEVQRGIARHYAIVNLARMLKITLRRTDVITLGDRTRGRFIVLCPETTTDGATILSDRIEVFAQQELGFSVACGTAIFPDDALTFEDVVRVAVSRVGNPSRPSSPSTPDRATEHEPRIAAEAN